VWYNFKALVVAAGHAMPSDNQRRFLRRSLEGFQVNLERAGTAASASYALIGAILVLGGIGYGLDQWLDTAPWCLFGGLTLGIVVGFYQLAMVVWRRQ
jgi:F0F1-type ATP synthase assembly protein I